MRRPAPVGGKDASPHAGEVRQFARLAQAEPPQLGEQIAQVQCRIPACRAVEIKDDNLPCAPEQVGRAEVAVQECGSDRGGRRLALESGQPVSQGLGLVRKPDAEFHDPGAQLVEQGGARP